MLYPDKISIHSFDQFLEQTLLQRLPEAVCLGIDFIADFLMVLLPKCEKLAESNWLPLRLSTKTTWLREMLLLEHEFCLEIELLCFPLMNVVFLFLHAERLAMRARDRLPSCDMKLDEALTPDLTGCSMTLVSLFCRLNNPVP